MKQILQSANTGTIEIAEVPQPQLLPGCVLVRVAASLVSAGTERASAEFAKKNLVQKAKARPDLVREVITKVRRDGIFSAVNAVRSRLDVPAALGYSSAGKVVEVAPGITDIQVGERVACAGAGYAVHSEYACVPRLLAARISSNATSWEEAAFTTLGAVALHGIRTAGIQLGDTVAVIGLGLMGQLTVQIIKASGCAVLGMDLRQDRCQMALRSGADSISNSEDDFRALCREKTNGNGVDSVLITAETPSSDPVNLAGDVARERGVVVAVGTVGMNLQRKLFYEKEIDFRVSRSYGPGRYDPNYEQKGLDYPIGYVRWTENRNMEAFLHLIAQDSLDLRSLITHRFPIQQATKAYELISPESEESSLAVLITYDDTPIKVPQLAIVSEEKVPLPSAKTVNVGLLGAGMFATGTLLPAMKRVSNLNLIGVCAANGSHSRHAADKFHFRYCGTDQREIVNDPAVNTVVISTRNHLHASRVISALNARKHVFCEKPLCLNEQELSDIARAYFNSPPNQLLMVGFNRRFAPMGLKMKAFVNGIREPLAMHYRINAGHIPQAHWVNDPDQGGGRLLGEVCHFIDFLAFLAGSPPVQVLTHGLPNQGGYSDDNLLITLTFPNGSNGTISYLANGDRSFAKERVEVFGGKSVAILEDFRLLELVSRGKKQVSRTRWRQDKGHHAEWQAFADAIISGNESPISFEAIAGSTLATFAAASSRSCGKSVSLDVNEFLAASSRDKRLDL